MDEVILVNERDRQTGRKDKVEAHLGEGTLHRAFVVMLFDRAGRLMLARRSPQKMLWPGYWDGTVASHPKEGESYPEAAKKRIKTELGIDVPLPEYLFKFKYHARYEEVGSEFEVCAVLRVDDVEEGRVKPDPGEVDKVMFTEPAKVPEIDKAAPWLLIALGKMEKVKNLEKLGDDKTVY